MYFEYFHIYWLYVYVCVYIYIGNIGIRYMMIYVFFLYKANGTWCVSFAPHAGSRVEELQEEAMNPVEVLRILGGFSPLQILLHQ